MKHQPGQTSQNDFERLRALRAERAELRAERARLDAREEELIRREERLASEMILAGDAPPYLVRTAYLLGALAISERQFHRLRNNPAKGFPQPITSIDSDPRWLWHEVEEWLARIRRPVSAVIDLTKYQRHLTVSVKTPRKLGLQA